MSRWSPEPPEVRFWAKVERHGDEECWPWTAFTDKDGYGRFTWTGRNQQAAHRIAYELTVGPVPPGLTLDHLCRNPPCVNPAHLEPVTRGDNVLRGIGTSAVNARKTRCVHGHEFDSANTTWWRGRRQCRACQRAYKQRRRSNV